MNSNNPKDLRRRVNELMKFWAPRHAQHLLAVGARLSDGHGLTWVCDDHPSPRLPDEEARRLLLHGELYENIPWWPPKNNVEEEKGIPYRRQSV